MLFLWVSFLSVLFFTLFPTMFGSSTWTLRTMTYQCRDITDPVRIKDQDGPEEEDKEGFGSVD